MTHHFKITSQVKRLRIQTVYPYNLEEKVAFKSFVSQPEIEISNHHALLTCSNCEAFGRVTIEAMKLGVPVIGANTGGCPEAINDETTGYVVDPLKTDEIANRMEDILIGKRIKREDCRTWAEAHDIHTAVKGIEAGYLRCLD